MQPKTDIIGNLMANKKRLYLIISGVVALIIIVFTLLANSGDTTPPRVAALSSRLAALANYTKSQSNAINSGDLREQNATLTIVLSGAAKDVSGLKSIAGVKADPEIAASNATRLADLKKTLESAKITNTFERTYKESITAELLHLQQSVASLVNSSGGTTKTVLTDVYKKLNNNRKALSELMIN